jgi:YlmC/YmxH family sporulation protein
MDLTYNELKNRDVINVVDGKCLGRIIDLTLSFPKGVLTGITVPGRRQNCLSRIFSKSEQFIGVNNIIKIGNDVILVNLRCGDTCSPSVPASEPPKPPRPCPKPPSCEDIFGKNIEKFDDPDDYQNL